MWAARLTLCSLLCFAVASEAGTVPVVQASLPSGSSLASRIAPLLPLPGQTVQIMKLGSQLTVVNLQQRVIEVGGSREALQNVLATISRGGVPSYDERLGISRDEFGKYIAFQPVLLPTGKSLKIPVVREGTRLLFGDAPGLNGVFKGIIFDLSTGELRVPEGFSVKPVARTPSSAPDRSLDISAVYVWDFKASYNAETQSGIKGQLSLFQMGNGQVVMGYKRTSMIRGIINEGELLLSYAR